MEGEKRGIRKEEERRMQGKERANGKRKEIGREDGLKEKRRQKRN